MAFIKIDIFRPLVNLYIHVYCSRSALVECIVLDVGRHLAFLMVLLTSTTYNGPKDSGDHSEESIGIGFCFVVIILMTHSPVRALHETGHLRIVFLNCADSAANFPLNFRSRHGRPWHLSLVFWRPAHRNQWPLFSSAAWKARTSMFVSLDDLSNRFDWCDDSYFDMMNDDRFFCKSKKIIYIMYINLYFYVTYYCSMCWV